MIQQLVCTEVNLYLPKDYLRITSIIIDRQYQVLKWSIKVLMMINLAKSNQIITLFIKTVVKNEIQATLNKSHQNILI